MPLFPELNEYFAAVQKSCLPGIWSRGVALARSSAVRLEKSSVTEILLRVSVTDRPVSRKVSLWPADEDAFCDCEDRVQPCIHIAAAIAALRNDLVVTEETSRAKRVVRYQFVREGTALRLARRVGDEVLTQPLASLVGGIQSGRIAAPPIDATQDDFSIDQIIGLDSQAEISRASWGRLWPFLKTISETQPGGILLGPARLDFGTPLPEFRARLSNEGKGLRLTLLSAEGVTEAFKNGPALFGETLRVFTEQGLSPSDCAALIPPGRFFSAAELPRLMTTILPEIERFFPVDRESARLPEVSEAPPRIVLRMERSGNGELSVVPTVEYASEFVRRDPGAEAALSRRLETDYRMVAGRRAMLQGAAALDLLRKISADPTVETRGTGAGSFRIESELKPELSVGEDAFSLTFRSPSGHSADPETALEAWRRGENFVNLLEGGFAPIPSGWFAEFAPILERLFALRAAGRGKLPAYAKPALIEIAERNGMALGESLRILHAKLGGESTIPELPADLRADLRPYQRTGVTWLRNLTDSGMGALLADDMGLGKTLQAISVIRGRTLVVAPKSVIHAWEDQLIQFRPTLRVSTYSGKPRALDPGADVTLVTYGLLRLESEVFEAVEWDLVVLDEAQTIKNPDSQIARAAHGLRARARIALSGTPVENRLADLWSQFEFLNPGLLGTRSEFEREFAGPVADGNAAAAEAFRRRVRFFILRRLKREVAPDLPEKTEIVLNCELSVDERALYTALLNSARKEVVAKLDASASTLSILELLLRLRQACCHPALVPGQGASSSSKLDLLVENLEKSIALGHRALVFSQWTSFLDLIEPKLRDAGISFSRLDGSTPNRDTVVREFQNPSGPSVLILSLKAGGVGITLTAADHVYLMDGWWNPAVEEQAADRAHRIGQKNPVLISRLIAEDTIEEKIFALQQKKRALSDSVLSGDLSGTAIDREELLELLDIPSTKP